MPRWLMSGESLIQSRLSPKALRLYDGRKLLTPAHIDARTGCRYYGPDELDRARRITLQESVRVAARRWEQVPDQDREGARQR
ncbi:MerR family transcriptional regulator [Micromonospora rubida]|uniref:MerR family transcriptional regulator n=1 Tax=Micromonospora rubida TaxID=2697657 RepID=A0ABW7SMQ5_9ACTN